MFSSSLVPPPLLFSSSFNDFENVQKQAFKIILRGNFDNYESALKTLSQETLEERRVGISLRFAKKSINHPKMKHLFKRNINIRPRIGANNKYKHKFIEPKVNSARAKKEAVNFFIRLLNEQT